MRRPVSEQWKIPGPNIAKKNQFSKYLKNFKLIRKNRQPNREKKKKGKRLKPAHHKQVNPEDHKRVRKVFHLTGSYLSARENPGTSVYLPAWQRP